MGWLLLILIAAAGAGGFYGGYQWEAGAIAQRDAKIAAAEATLQIESDKQVALAANHISDMEVAYEVGQSRAKIVTKTIIERGTAAAASDKGISNPACVASDNSLHILIGALAGMRTSSDPGRAAATMLGPGAADQRDLLGNIPAAPAEHGTMGPVHTDAGTTGGNGQISSPSVSAHPKPKPIGR